MHSINSLVNFSLLSQPVQKISKKRSKFVVLFNSFQKNSISKIIYSYLKDHINNIVIQLSIGQHISKIKTKYFYEIFHKIQHFTPKKV
jgi:hypothetical protein